MAQRRAHKTPSQLLYEHPGRRNSSNPTSPTSSSNAEMSVVFNGHMISLAEVDLESYVKDAQPYIKQAIDDPGTLSSRNLREVARVIVSRSWEDVGYHSTAAALCNFIAQKEVKAQVEFEVPTYSFREGLNEVCMSVLEEAAAMQECDMQYWINFVHFLAEAYTMLDFGGQHLKSLADLLFQVLLSLARPPRVTNFDQVELLTSVLHQVGGDLQEEDKYKMHKLMCCLRDAFLEPCTSRDIRVMLLPIIEKGAGHWTLSDSASQYYFGL